MIWAVTLTLNDGCFQAHIDRVINREPSLYFIVLRDFNLWLELFLFWLQTLAPTIQLVFFFLAILGLTIECNLLAHYVSSVPYQLRTKSYTAILLDIS